MLPRRFAWPNCGLVEMKFSGKPFARRTLPVEVASVIGGSAGLMELT
jgi:hypothetical protein